MIDSDRFHIDFLSVTASEEERKESWNALDNETKEAFKNGPISKWDCGAGELVKTTTKLIKVWHCILCML